MAGESSRTTRPAKERLPFFEAAPGQLARVPLLAARDDDERVIGTEPSAAFAHVLDHQRRLRLCLGCAAPVEVSEGSRLLRFGQPIHEMRAVLEEGVEVVLGVSNDLGSLESAMPAAHAR